MIPDATEIAAGAAMVESGFTSYPVLGLVLGIVIVLWAGSYAVRKLKGAFGR